ncbi:hypothetical protein SRHO_G00254240 [Serrasalmus rhombeus]
MGSNGQDGPLILFFSLHLFLDVGDSSKPSIMRPLMPLCLSMLCLLLPTASVTMAGFNTSATTVSTASKAPTHTAVVSTNATEGLSSSALHTFAASVTAQRENNSMSTKATITTHQSTETIKPQNAKPSNAGTVGGLLVFILVLIILLVFAFRWYMLNPARRSFRGLWYSIVETARLAWSTIRGCLQRPQKRAEEIEEDEEVVEMEAGGGGGENMEEVPKEEGAKQEEDNDSDSDSSLEEYSIVDAANLAEGEKQTGGEEEDRKSAKEEGGETEEMTSVTLEDDEKAEPEEVDDLTPL